MNRYSNDDFCGKKILITGGAGFIGSNLAFYFQEYHPCAKVVVFDSFKNDEKFENGNYKSLGDFKNLIGFRGEVICGDICKKEDLERLLDYGFDYIFHQAAVSDTTVDNQELVLRANTNAFKDILDIAIKMHADVIYASSAGTYGNTKAPNRVGFAEKPENVYGFSKLMMDNMAYSYIKRYSSISIVGLRYFNVYGEREYYKGKTASMILQLGMQALEHKRVKLFKHGEQKRDFVYIQDVIQANVKAMNPKKNGVYNVGFGKARSFNDICDNLKEHLGDFRIDYIDNPYSFYQNYTLADIEETTQALEYEPKYSLENGISSYVDEIKLLYSSHYYD